MSQDAAPTNNPQEVTIVPAPDRLEQARQSAKEKAVQKAAELRASEVIKKDLAAATASKEAPAQDSEADAKALDAEDSEPKSEADSAEAKSSEEKQETKPEDEGLESDKLRKFAKKEQRLREERKAFEAERAELVPLFQALRDAPKNLAKDPVGFLKTIGYQGSLQDIALELWNSELGDAAPKEWQERRNARLLQAQLDEVKREAQEARAEAIRLKQEREEERQQTQYQKALNEYKSGISEYLKNLPKDFEWVPDMLVDGHDKVTEILIEKAAEITARTGEPPSPADLVKTYEAELRDRLGKFAVPRSKVQNTAPQGSKPVVRTISQQLAVTTKPNAPALTDDERKERAIQKIREAQTKR